MRATAGPISILAVALLFALVIAAIGGCGGKEEQATQTTSEESPAAADSAAAEGFVWHAYEAGMRKAMAEEKYVLIDFWTSWCHWCKVMDRETYTDAAVARVLARDYVAIKVDAESSQAQGDAVDAPTGIEIASQYGVASYPTTYFVDPAGAKIAPLPGYLPPKDFILRLEYVATGSYRDISLQEYIDTAKAGG